MRLTFKNVKALAQTSALLSAGLRYFSINWLACVSRWPAIIELFFTSDAATRTRICGEYSSLKPIKNANQVALLG